MSKKAKNAIEQKGVTGIKKKTGELLFQFDDDEPQKIHDVHENEDVSFRIGHPDTGGTMNFIGFTKDGKKFKLFIKNVTDANTW